MTKKENNVLDRIELSFSLLKKNFLWLFIGIFIYNLLGVFGFWLLIFLIFALFADVVFEILYDQGFSYIDFFSQYSMHSVIFYVSIWICIFLLYILFYIPIFLWLIYSIKKSFNNENVTIKNTFQYGFSRFFRSFKTYWYIFSYVALIPALVFIFWWILFNLWEYYFGSDTSFWNVLWITGFWLMVFSTILFLVFFIYRWVKTTFSIHSAVDKDCFDKSNFDFSLLVTKNKWWKILWNILLLGLIIWWIWSFVSSIITIFFSSYFDLFLLSIKSEEHLKSFLDSFSIFSYTFSSILNEIINSIWVVFMIVFVYIYFKDLEDLSHHK